MQHFYFLDSPNLEGKYGIVVQVIVCDPVENQVSPAAGEVTVTATISIPTIESAYTGLPAAE